MSWMTRIRTLFGGAPVHEAAGRGRRALAWMPGNPGAVAAMLATSNELRVKSRDLVRRNAWANAGIEAFVANAVGTGIKPQSMAQDETFRVAVQALWRDWTEEADATGQTDFYGLQSLAARAMCEGGECFIRLRPRRPEDRLTVPLQLQLLEAEHLPLTLNTELPSGNVVRSGIEFDAMGRRVAYHLYRSHPEDGRLSPMSGQGGQDTVRVPAAEIMHLYRVLRPGQIRGEPWLARALVKLNELDQYDDAELVRKKTAAMFAGFITRLAPEDNLMGEGLSDADGVSLAGLEPGTLQILEPGEDVKFSDPADVGGSYAEFLRTQFRAVAAAIGITYEQLTGDLCDATCRDPDLVSPPGAGGDVQPGERLHVAGYSRGECVMPRVGFKKTWAAGTFDKAAVQTLFAHLKTYVTNAGFNVLLDTVDGIDFIRLGSPAGTAHDDVPHWAFSFQDQDPYGAIFAYPVYGNDYLDEAAYAHSYTIVHSAWVGNPSPEITVWFAADGAAGWWWLHASQEDTNSTTGVSMRFAVAGATSRRYPSDTHQGLCARYGIWDPWGDWEPAYAKDEDGVVDTYPWTGTWSPFGEGWTFNGKRHAGSPVPKMAVPQFPNRDGGISACILGEFNEVLILTDGYAQEEVVVPGWIAMIGDEWDQPYAVPAPPQFDDPDAEPL